MVLNRWQLILIWCFLVPLLGPPFSQVEAESPAEIKLDEEAIRKQMVQWTEELGVTCTECHNLRNFKDSQSKGFRVGRDHARIVNLMKANGFDGIKGPLANCYMCHRGDLHPPVHSPKKK